MTAVSDIVGQRVRFMRKRRGWTVVELAERCPELTGNSLYAIENGRRQDDRRTRTVSVDELCELMAVFGCIADDLLSLPDATCRRCHGEPPFGFTCNTCGAFGT